MAKYFYPLMERFSESTMADKPNVLCISIDSLRLDYCSIYGSKKGTTPNISKLAEKSTVYANAISPSTWTLEVHTSVFTGLYPLEHQVFDKNISLGNHPTFAEVLRDDGYSTKSFGHNGWLEAGSTLRGFEHHHTHKPGDVESSDSDLKSEKFSHIVSKYLEKTSHKLKKELFRHTSRDERTINNVLAKLESEDSDFCYFVHLNDVHYPYQPHIKYFREFDDTDIRQLRNNIRLQDELVERRPETYSKKFVPLADQLEVMKNLYCGCIRQVDDLVGRLIRSLEEKGALDDTIIVIFGDHGDLFGEHGHFGHQFSVDDKLIRVPFLIHDPTGTITEGTSQDIVQLNDIYPTVLSLCGLDCEETESVDLTCSTRSSAYVHYVAPESYLDRLRPKYNLDSLPPKRQYCIWKSPSQKLVWYPEIEQFDEKSSRESPLFRDLKRHLDRLSPIDPIEEEVLDLAVKENLEDMGYL